MGYVIMEMGVGELNLKYSLLALLMKVLFVLYHMLSRYNRQTMIEARQGL